MKRLSFNEWDKQDEFNQLEVEMNSSFIGFIKWPDENR